MVQEEIYQKLKMLRKEKGLTLNDLAEKIGLDYQQISRIERGKSKLTIDALMKMAHALETEVSEIIEPHVVATEKQQISSPLDPYTTTSQKNLLTFILEKIEEFSLYHKLSPSLKAALCSLIYSEAIKREDPFSLVDYSLHLITCVTGGS